MSPAQQAPVVRITPDRRTTVNGRPFFLIGARHMPDGGNPKMLCDAGFNAYRWLAFGHEQQEAQPMPPRTDGIRFWAYIYDRADFTKSPSYPRQLQERVRELRQRPDFLCYENLNEPTLKHRRESFKSTPEDLAAGTEHLRRLDPDHPIWLAHHCGNTVETLRRYNPCCDATGANPYPVYVQGMRRHVGMRHDGRVLDCPDQSIHAAGKYTQKMMEVGQGRLAVWMFVQAMAYEHFFSPNYTPEYAADLSLIHI